ISTGSGNDLKPRSLTACRCTGADPNGGAGRYRRSCLSSSRASGASSAGSASSKISRIPRGSRSGSSVVSRRRRSSELVGRRSAMRPDRMPETAPLWSELCDGAVFQPRERLARCLLLGVLLRPSLASPELFAVDDRRAREAPFVRRPLDGDLGIRHVTAAAGEQLLQVRLVVDA